MARVGQWAKVRLSVQTIDEVLQEFGYPSAEYDEAIAIEGEEGEIIWAADPARDTIDNERLVELRTDEGTLLLLERDLTYVL